MKAKNKFLFSVAFICLSIVFFGNSAHALCSGCVQIDTTIPAGSNNIGIGNAALYSNSGNSNLAIGITSLATNTSGGSNVGLGTQTLVSNRTGNFNVALGSQAAAANVDGSSNTAVGTQALFQMQSGYGNVAVGQQALSWLAMGSKNVAIGYSAGSNVPSSTNEVVIIGTNDGSTLKSGEILISNGNGREAMRVTSDGKTGIGTSTPVATLDVNGFVRLKSYSAPPVSCDESNAGITAYTSQYIMCVCASRNNRFNWYPTMASERPCTW